MMKTLLAAVSGFVVATMAIPQSSPMNRPAREHIEWLNVWMDHANQNDLPRVLLVGDSITQNYYPQVRDALKEIAYVDRLTTSKSLGDPFLLQEIALILKQNEYHVIHFNNGLHGWSYTEEEYERDFPKLLTVLSDHTIGAKLVWASTTPVRDGTGALLEEKTTRVRQRNLIAQRELEDQGIPTNPLFELALDHPEHFRDDGVHMNADGIKEQAKQVTDWIRRAIAP